MSRQDGAVTDENLSDRAILQRLLDIEEIRHLKARYFRLLDAKDWSAWIDVFTPDLEFIYLEPSIQNPPPGAEVLADGTARVSREVLVAFISEAMKSVTTVHHGHMPEITFADRDTARGHWALTNYYQYRTADGSYEWSRGYGHYDDIYVRTDRGWRIQRSVFFRRDMDLPTRP